MIGPETELDCTPSTVIDTGATLATGIAIVEELRET